MREQAQTLHSFRGMLGTEQPQDLFETGVGQFWGILDARDYCRTRYQLAFVLAHIAHIYEVRPLIEAALNHRLELMRLIASDNMGLRFTVPFDLLRLNRDDDCYDFIKYWIKRDGDSDDERHQRSLPGQWIYPRGNDKYEDSFQVCDLNPDYIDLAFLAALCIIKLRIIAAHNARIESFNLFEETDMGKFLGDACMQVQTSFIGDDQQYARIERQEQQVAKCFDIMQAINPTLLPAIVNPRPLKSQPHPEFISGGSPSDGWGVLMNCNRHFVRIPGVEKRITAMVGGKLSYNCDTTSF